MELGLRDFRKGQTTERLRWVGNCATLLGEVLVSLVTGKIPHKYSRTVLANLLAPAERPILDWLYRCSAAEEDWRLVNRLVLWSSTCGDQEANARIRLFAQWHRERCPGHRFDSTHA